MESAAQFLERAGLSFGLPRERLEALCRLSEEAGTLGELLRHPEATDASLAAPHWLRLRRGLLRYRALRGAAAGLSVERLGALEIEAARFSARHGAGEAEPARLHQRLLARAGQCLKQGRLRFLAMAPHAALPPEIARFASHSESCADVPPHRWFAARRGVADRLLRLEIVCAPDDAAGHQDVEAPDRLALELERAAERAVVRAIDERCQDEVIEQAAEALCSLLSRPPLLEAVGGVACGRKEIRSCVSGGEHDGESAVFERADLAGVADWMKARRVERVALFVLTGTPGAPEIASRFAERTLSCEPARAAGLMKQARGQAGIMLEEAARVAARRLRDPLEGYADVPADELGLGEYLDCVDGEMLRSALEDVRAAVAWERAHRAHLPLAEATGAPSPIVRKLSDLKPGMELGGTVSNLTGFGAFVELGLPVQGLIHVSELADRFVRHPSEVVRVGQRLHARVLSVDLEKARISLSLRKDGTRRAARDKRQEALSKLETLFRK
ncbi:MAG: S1 RNA-binding domain-containing protein [Myxococcales bacterium]|nr:S1 RNA-binding domain-containing protein [Myxococcales bacterium]